MDLDAVQERLPSHLIGVERWRPSDGCSLKINFDATYRAPSKASCRRIVIRNAVSLGLDLGFQDVVVEGDALIVILKVLSPMSDNSVLGAYIRDNKLWVRSFRRCVFKHMLREGNIVAHLLAIEILKGGNSYYLNGRVLDFTLLAVESDQRFVFRGKKRGMGRTLWGTFR
ncbi:hypothetical protein PVK06_017508 [Gossypium arboreum]|uniref:RNase H type-1 domain-containing protein n=1 Tax=Gossypium arboreum TaxID=29729 RepID=A0ABR0Q2X7_GOSAR|nr:hypothetical protein PVK06_017508 [Gossypium arboreum]